MDDTLYAERSFVKSGFRAVSAWAEVRLGIQKDLGFSQLCQLYEMGCKRTTFDEWVRSVTGGVDRSLIFDLIEVYRNHVPDIQLCEGAEVTLNELKREYRLGLMGDGYVNTQRNKFNALRLHRFFDEVLFSDELGKDFWKPSVVPYLEMANRLGIEPSAIVYVGDNPEKDFVGARRAGMFSIRIRSPQGVYSRIEARSSEYEADVEIHDVNHVRDALARLNEITMNRKQPQPNSVA
jgi:putative hydrolase of the HAD superfamily